MKQITEIREMDNKGVIDSFEGNIKTVYDPSDPSPAQANAGIHRQFIVVEDGGETMGVSLMKRQFHIGKNHEGARFRFESTRDDKGNLGGLEVSKYEKEGKMRTSVDVWGSASIYCLDQVQEEKESSKPESGAVSSMPDREIEKSADNSVDGAVNSTPARALAAPKGNIARLAKLHLASLITVRATHHSLNLPNKVLKDIATSIFIELNKSNTKCSSEVKAILEREFLKEAQEEFDAEESEGDGGYEPRPDQQEGPSTEEPEPDPASQPASQEELDEQRESKPEPEKFNKNWKAVKDDEGRVISQLGKQEIIDLAIKYLPFHNTESPKIKTALNAIMRTKVALELTYCEIYDVFDVLLQNDHDKAAIDTAYDEFKKKFKGDDEDLCKNILFDQSTFKQQIKNYEPTTA